MGLALALALAGWIFAYKLCEFNALTLTSDGFSFEQLSRTWLEGSPYRENHYGNVLSTHTYLLAPVLALFTVPLGLPGLFVALALCSASGGVAAGLIAHRHGVSRPMAVLWGALLTLMPLGVSNVMDPPYGFHIELLAPGLGLWLAYFLLRRQWVGSIATAIALLSVKEEMPILVGAIALAVACEHSLRSWVRRNRRGEDRVNKPAIAVLAMACIALPLLLWIIKMNPPAAGSPGSFTRLRPVDGSVVTGGGGLAAYVIAHWKLWLLSPRAYDAVVLFSAASLGLIWFRPHWVALGLVTTLVSWLMQDNFQWAPRFAPALAFCEVAGTLGFVSAMSHCRLRSATGWGLKLGAAAWSAAIAALILHGLAVQVRRCGGTEAFYAVRPPSSYSHEEIRQADAVFSEYRRLSKPSEPVVASDYLFKYAHDRNLSWADGLHGDFRPVWALRDLERVYPLETVERLFNPDSYVLVKSAGRFALYRRRRPTDAPVSSLHAWSGPVRLRLKFPPFTGVVSEPLVSTGGTDAGDLVYVTYLAPGLIRFGHDSSAGGANESANIKIDQDLEHSVEINLASLNPGGWKGPGMVVKIDGRTAMLSTRGFFPSKPWQVVFGYNAVNLSAALPAFRGSVFTAEPDLSWNDHASSEFATEWGAAELTIVFGTNPAVNEPILSSGVSGRGDVVFVTRLSSGRLRFAVDHWGYGLGLGPEMAVDPSVAHVIVVRSAALLPPEDSPDWGQVPAATRRRLRQGVEVWIDGKLALDSGYEAYPSEKSLVVPLVNAIHCSSCSDFSSASLLEARRLGLDFNRP